MSLLDRGTEVVTVYPEEMITDSDGNKLTRPSAVGVILRASVQPINRPTVDAERDGLAVSRYRLRLVGYPDLLGAQSAVEWGGKRYAIDGDALVYTGSRRTARAEYVMVRK